MRYPAGYVALPLKPYDPTRQLGAATAPAACPERSFWWLAVAGAAGAVAGYYYQTKKKRGGRR